MFFFSAITIQFRTYFLSLKLVFTLHLEFSLPPCYFLACFMFVILLHHCLKNTFLEYAQPQFQVQHALRLSSCVCLTRDQHLTLPAESALLFAPLLSLPGAAFLTPSWLFSTSSYTSVSILLSLPSALFSYLPLSQGFYSLHNCFLITLDYFF